MWAASSSKRPAMQPQWIELAAAFETAGRRLRTRTPRAGRANREVIELHAVAVAALSSHRWRPGPACWVISRGGTLAVVDGSASRVAFRRGTRLTARSS